MGLAAVEIPEKLFFKIGEVCEIVGVQAHVLRYWETEFPMFSPQKNRAGQRTYRKRDVEIALHIKELLYEELYTIAGAKKKLANELRAGSKLKAVEQESVKENNSESVSPKPQYKAEPDPPTKKQQPQQTYERDYYPKDNRPQAQTKSASYQTETRNEVTRMPLPSKTKEQAKQPSVSKLAFELKELLAMMDANDAEMKKKNHRR